MLFNKEVADIWCFFKENFKRRGHFHIYQDQNDAISLSSSFLLYN